MNISMKLFRMKIFVLLFETAEEMSQFINKRFKLEVQVMTNPLMDYSTVEIDS